MKPRPHFEPLLTRREMLLRGGGVLGRLPWRRSWPTKRPPNPSPLRRSLQKTAIRGQGQKALSSSSWKEAEPPRPVRPEAAPAKTGRPAAAQEFQAGMTAMGEMESPRWPISGSGGARASGLWVSDGSAPGRCVDQIAVIRSCVTDGTNGRGGVCQTTPARPGGLGRRRRCGPCMVLGMETIDLLPSSSSRTISGKTVKNPPADSGAASWRLFDQGS